MTVRPLLPPTPMPKAISISGRLTVLTLGMILVVSACDDLTTPDVKPGATTASSSRWAKAESQSEMNQAAADDLADANAELELTLAELRQRAKAGGDHETRAIELLDAAQAAWHQFLEAQIAMELPTGSDVWHGSIEPMRNSQRRAKLVHSRIEQLREMLSSDEGNLCAPRWPYE